MPQRSKKSRAALARKNQQKKSQNQITDKENETNPNTNKNDFSNITNLAAGIKNETNVIHTNDNIPVDALGIKYVKRVQGNFHQGDYKQFSYESVGVQCSCNALVMLCKVNSIFHNLMPRHLDDVLRSGDNLYKITAKKLEACDELARDRTLENDQLPKTVVIEHCQYSVDYDTLRYGTLDDERESDFDTLDVEINKSFTISQRNILIFGGYMMALYKDIVTDQYLFFDSHSRDRSGYPSPDGTAVARIFPDIDSLLKFLHVLADNLNLNPRNFAIQPVIVTILESNTQRSTRLVRKEHQISTNMCTSEDRYNEPGCSTWNSHHTEPIQQTGTFISKFHKQSTLNNSASKNALTLNIKDDKNRTVSDNKSNLCCETNVCVPGKSPLPTHLTIITAPSTSKQIQSKEDTKRLSRYEKWFNNLPTSKKNELLSRKRKSSYEDYVSPQKAKRKRKQARQGSKSDYQNPVKATRKREQARQGSKRRLSKSGKSNKKT